MDILQLDTNCFSDFVEQLDIDFSMPYLLGYTKEKDAWHGLIGSFEKEGLQQFASKFVKMGGARKAYLATKKCPTAEL
mgnify:CR=1 FL=1